MSAVADQEVADRNHCGVDQWDQRSVDQRLDYGTACTGAVYRCHVLGAEVDAPVCNGLANNRRSLGQFEVQRNAGNRAFDGVGGNLDDLFDEVVDRLSDDRVDLVADQFGIRVLVVDAVRQVDALWTLTRVGLVQVDVELARRKIDAEHFVLRGDRLRQELLEDFFLDVGLGRDVNCGTDRQCRRDGVEQVSELAHPIDGVFQSLVDRCQLVVDSAGNLADDWRFKFKICFGYAILAVATHAIRILECAIYGFNVCAANAGGQFRLADDIVGQSVSSGCTEQRK